MNDKLYVIAEIGANHNGDLALAKRLIDAAVACGCDAAKFQSWSPTSLISKSEYAANQKYDDSPKKHFGSLREMVEKYYLREEQHFELSDYCRKKGIDFCSTPFSPKEVALLNDCNVPFYKIASMDITNPILLTSVAQTGKPIVLSTGMATLGEIEAAIATLVKNGAGPITLLHCISIYPPELDEINLNNISTLRSTFGLPVGFSDHSIGTAIPLAAVALGAVILEKHFTLDKNMEGWDHEISADPREMETIVREGRNIQVALGVSQRTISLAEIEKKHKFRRSVVAAKKLTSGHTLTIGDLDVKRPGTGIPSERVYEYVGRILTVDLDEDDLICESHFR